MNDLFIGGGGFSGIMFIGVLDYLHNNNLLELKRFYGCSIGSLIGILYISGREPKDILNFFLELDLKALVKYDITNISNNNCILNEDLFNKLVSYIPGDVITIKDFVDVYKIDINIHTTNITDNVYNFFNINTSPNVNIREAIKASMSIPFLFAPINIDNKMHIDGCCKNIYGSPTKDIYISGYSIIFEPYESNDYFSRVFHSLINRDLPNTKYLIRCSCEADVSKYFKLGELDKRQSKLLYLSGIKKCIETLE